MQEAFAWFVIVYCALAILGVGDDDEEEIKARGVVHFKPSRLLERFARWCTSWKAHRVNEQVSIINTAGQSVADGGLRSGADFCLYSLFHRLC